MTNVRDTSIEAYNKIKADGLLSRLRFDVYDIIFHHGPMTQGECWRDYFNHARQRHSVAPRFAELKRHRVIREVGNRPCGVTGMTAILWDVTSNLPEKLEDRDPPQEWWIGPNGIAYPTREVALRSCPPLLIKHAREVRT